MFFDYQECKSLARQLPSPSYVFLATPSYNATETLPRSTIFEHSQNYITFFVFKTENFFKCDIRFALFSPNARALATTN